MPRDRRLTKKVIQTRARHGGTCGGFFVTSVTWYYSRACHSGRLIFRRCAGMSKRIRIKAGKDKNLSVWAIVRQEGTHLRLERAEPDIGEMPDVSHLVGSLFPDMGALRRSVVAAMTGVTGDTLDHVVLTQVGYEMAVRALAHAAGKLEGSGISPDEIPDEQAKSMPDGSLLIWVDLPNGQRIETSIPEKEWAWRKRPN